MRLPDFLIIGTSRGGTTSLFHVLRHSDGIFMPRRTELHFFSMRLFADPNAQLSGYARHFAEARRDEVVGEKSPSYLWFPDAAASIHDRLPHVKLISTLRDPAERAISDFKISIKPAPKEADLLRLIDEGIRDLLSGKPFKTVFDPAAIVWKGMYGHHLRRFLRLFGEDRLLLIDFESLKDGQRVLTEITDFIGAKQTNVALTHTNSSPPVPTAYETALAHLRAFYRRADDFETLRRALRVI
jgi:hypothetical protein